MSIKEKFEAAKANAAVKKAEKTAKKAAEEAAFAALPIDQKEQIRSMQAARRSLYICTGAVCAGMAIAGAAAIIQAKASRDAANAAVSDADYAGYTSSSAWG